MAHQPPAALKFDQLPLCIMERIVGLLEAKDQGRAACSMRLCRQAVAPRAPALYHFTSRGDASAVARLLQDPAVRAAVDVQHGPSRSTALYLAVGQTRTPEKSLALVDALLAGGADPNADTYEMPVLQAVMMIHPHLGLAQRLIAAGADVNATSSRGETALLLACRARWLAGVDCLLQGGANVNAANGHGCTPLMEAASIGYGNKARGIVERLIAAGADVLAVDDDGHSALMKACMAGSHYSHDVGVEEALLSAGADVNGACKEGRTPLMMACEMGRQDVITCLLKAGADVLATTRGGKTALMLIAALPNLRYHSWVFDILVQAGVDLHALDEDGRSAACIAVETQKTSLVDELITAGVMPSPRACYRALIAAYDEVKPELVAKLVAAGAAVDLKDIKEWAVLIPPSATGDVDEIDRLLQAGALVDLEGPAGNPEAAWDNFDFGDHGFGKTALLCAAQHGSVPAVSRLLEASADINARSADGLTALMLASKHGHIAVVQRLLDASPDLEAVAHDYNADEPMTALEFAWMNGHSNVCIALLQAGAKLMEWRGRNHDGYH